MDGYAISNVDMDPDFNCDVDTNTVPNMDTKLDTKLDDELYSLTCWTMSSQAPWTLSVLPSL